MLRHAIAALRPALRDIDFASIQRAAEFIDHPTATQQVDLVSHLRLFLEGDKVFLAEWNAPIIDSGWPQIAPGSSPSLPVPGEMALLNGFRLVASLQEVPSRADFVPPAGSPLQTWLDADQVSYPLSLRTRRPGNRYCPLGMDGHSLKLSDFFINHNLPVRARRDWPLVCSGETIAWVPGFQPAHHFRVTPETRRLLHLVVLKT